jgi:hypothetical protein
MLASLERIRPDLRPGTQEYRPDLSGYAQEALLNKLGAIFQVIYSGGW